MKLFMCDLSFLHCYQNVCSVHHHHLELPSSFIHSAPSQQAACNETYTTIDFVHAQVSCVTDIGEVEIIWPIDHSKLEHALLSKQIFAEGSTKKTYKVLVTLSYFSMDY
jgi:hypothetical protein